MLCLSDFKLYSRWVPLKTYYHADYNIARAAYYK